MSAQHRSFRIQGRRQSLRVCVVNKEALKLFLGNNMSLQMAWRKRWTKKITIAIGKTGQEAKGGEDTHRQGESHKGKLNSLVNVSNQGTNLPGIGCLTNRAH